MRPARTLLVGIIAFAFGIFVATRFPLSAAGQVQPTQQPPPLTVTKGPDGVTFQSRTKNRLVIVQFGEQQQARFRVETGQRVISPTGSSFYRIYEVTGQWQWTNELGPCLPDCPPPPPPCPGCPPFVSNVWQVGPAMK